MRCVYFIKGQIIITIVISLLLSFQSYAQEEAQYEPSIWSGIFVTKKMNKNFSLRIKTSFHTQLSNYSARFNDVGFRYNLDHNWSISGFYRFNCLFEPEQRRAYIESNYKAPFKSRYFSLSGRFRWQQKWNAETQIFQYTWRPRLKLTLKHPNLPFKYYSSGELFQEIHCHDFDRYRVSMGIKTRLTKDIDIRIFFRHQKELGQDDNKAINTFNLNYMFRF